ncbi:hypothetical protein E8E11_006451 [Didymella keratinophila]|nr:hypothetical protein E8E11_006451 [Didymella keratinophila]
MQPQPQVKRCTSNLREVERVERDGHQNPNILVDAKAFEHEVGRPTFTSELLEYAAQQQERCENTIRLHLQSTYEQAWYTYVPYKFTASETWPLDWLGTLEGDQIKLEDLAMPALRRDFNDRHPLRQYVAAMPFPRHTDLLDRMYTDFSCNPVWLCLKKQILRSVIKIDNIVCIAFGTLTDESRPKARLRSHQQHFLPRAIADTHQDHLTIANEKAASSIPIVAHDPDYRLGDMNVIFRFSPPIDIVSMPHHFLSITENSLVIIAGTPPGAPVLEVLTDVLYPTGPAAILKDEVWRYWFHDEGKIWQCDQRTPRVNRFLETLHGDLWITDLVDEEKQCVEKIEGRGVSRY